jgi:CPA1 family monovalent cation:H+ antiporter
MTQAIQTLMLLLAIGVAVAVVAQRLKLAPSILLVIAGVALAFIPGLPTLVLAPEFVLLVILPPLIYSAGVAMSWREFRFSLRLISLLAFGCVVFTTCAIAVALHYLLGWGWGVAFLLGAIIAPPDVVAPLAIARRLGIPRRLVVVLEGEGLANDATALILYRFAVAAVATGMFSLPKAAGTFALIVVGEIIWGIAVGWLALRLRHWAHNPRAEITLSLMTPYLAYWVPEHLGGSGVLATVACGLYVSWNGPLLISAATRLQGIFFWDLITYVIEGLVFLVTGLQARLLLEKAQWLSLLDLAIAIGLTTAIAIVARFVWVFPAIYVPRWTSASLRKRDPSPPWQYPMLLSYTGIRGVVSLAAALAIPLTTAAGEPFPYRDLILLVTFGVIIITLVGQGLLLPSMVRWLGLAHAGRAEQNRERQIELEVRTQALDAALARLDALAAERKLPPEALELLRARHDQRVRQLPKSTPDGVDFSHLNVDLRMDLIDTERRFLYQLLRDGKLTDESRRRIERELDLEEEMVACRKEGETPL